MSQRQFVLSFAIVLLVGFTASEVRAQYAPPPPAYSVTQVNSMFGPSVHMQIYRDGSKAMIDLSHAALPGGKPSHLRTLYDLQSHRSYTWDLLNTATPCGGATFSGDWGDPFALSAELNAELAKQHGKQTGTATLNGIATKIFETDTPDGAGKVWIDPQYGLVVKFDMTPKAGQPRTMIETSQLSVSKPPASVFVLPPVCAAAAQAPPVPPPPTEAELIAADTGGHAQDYASAITPPSSKNSCSVLVKIVRAGSLQPISVSGVQIALDTTVDPDHLPHYVTGVGGPGQWTFSGGGIHEVTGQMRNGTLRIENAPPYFQMEVAFGNAGEAMGLIYRQCFGPQTTLLLVIKNPGKLSDGARWLWAKSGK